MSIPGRLELNWPESSKPVKNYDAQGVWRKEYGYSTCTINDPTISAHQFEDLIIKTGICAASNMKARDELNAEFAMSAQALQEDLSLQKKLEEAAAADGVPHRRKKHRQAFDPDNPFGDGDHGEDGAEAEPCQVRSKITMRQFLEIFAKWRMAQYSQWTPLDKKEYGKLTLGELLLRLKHEWREGWGLVTTTNFVAMISEDRWLMARDPVVEALTDFDCMDLKVLFDNVTVIHKAEQDLRASRALTLVPWLRDHLTALITTAKVR